MSIAVKIALIFMMITPVIAWAVLSRAKSRDWEIEGEALRIISGRLRIRPIRPRTAIRRKRMKRLWAKIAP